MPFLPPRRQQPGERPQRGVTGRQASLLGGRSPTLSQGEVTCGSQGNKGGRQKQMVWAWFRSLSDFSGWLQRWRVCALTPGSSGRCLCSRGTPQCRTWLPSSLQGPLCWGLMYLLVQKTCSQLVLLPLCVASPTSGLSGCLPSHPVWSAPARGQTCCVTKELG